MTALFCSRKLWVFGISMLVGIGGILYGYDIGVVSGALLFIHQSIPMTDTQTGMIVGAVLGGGLVGTLIAGPLADKYGRRAMIATSSVVFIIGVFMILLAHSFLTLLLARLFLGVGVGIVAVAVPLYVAELVPADDRGKYVTFFQLFLTFGILLAYFVDLLFIPSGNWRAMFSVVLIPAVILLLGVIRLPETPRWLIENGREELGRQVLSRTHTKQQAEHEYLDIVNSLHQVESSWSELFSRKMLYPLFIAVGIAILNQLTGINAFLQYAPSLLKSSGLSSNFAAMLGSVGIGAINFICTIIAIFLVDRVGRRPLLITGTFGIVIAEAFLGLVNYIHISPQLSGFLSLLGLFAFIVFFAIGPGVVVWLAISELFPTNVRGKGIALCLFFNSLAGSLLAGAFLDMNHTLGMSGSYWFCAVCSLFYFLLAYFCLPETKAKTLEEIQSYFCKQKTSFFADQPTSEF